MAQIQWYISNITCVTCVSTIKKSLEKNNQSDINISLVEGRVGFEHNDKVSIDKLKISIQNLGYRFVGNNANSIKNQSVFVEIKKLFIENWLFQFVFCSILTLPLLLHMFVHAEWSMNSWVQWAFATPVYFLGCIIFGKSAWRSIKNLSPNMDVLIVLGASAAYIYSVYGSLILKNNDYLFFETSATIFTLVLFGNWIEHRTLSVSQKEIKKLLQTQSSKATMIAFDDKYQEQYFEVEAKSLRVGDLVIIKSGDLVPADAKILAGEGAFNEALITGESLEVAKKNKDKIIGGSTLVDGNVKAQIIAVGEDSVLGQIIQSVRNAELEKPNIQLLADKISSIFVPIVLIISAITFISNFFVFHHTNSESLMRAIAVLVIACPCALGLATPAAVAVGLGRAAKNGILFKHSNCLEYCNQIKQIVFDKTGTLTTGELKIKNFEFYNISKADFQHIVASIEKHSNHPIAKSINKKWPTNTLYPFQKVEEIKGIGIKAIDKNGDVFMVGSEKTILLENKNIPDAKSIYVYRNNEFIGWIDLEDEIRAEAKKMIQRLQQRNIEVFLLSGDNKTKCLQVAQQLNITNILYSQSPEQKIQKIIELQNIAPTVMVGDGINDAPALAKSSIGISINGAAQISIEASSVVLMNNNLLNVEKALLLGKFTHQTIRQNLYWAFMYNIIALPIAATGVLNPSIAALTMGLSDIVLLINSVRLYIKKIE